MHRITQTELEHLTVKCILYTVYMYLPQRPIGLFRSTTSSFQDKRSPKIRNATNDPKLNLHLKVSVKSTQYTLNTYP